MCCLQNQVEAAAGFSISSTTHNISGSNTFFNGIIILLKNEFYMSVIKIVFKLFYDGSNVGFQTSH